MALALALAEEAAGAGEVPVGCVVVSPGGEVIGRGRNRREEDGDASAHAELLAIREACARTGDWRLEGCALYVTLEPCPMCAGAISQARAKSVVFAAHDRDRGCAGSIYRIPEDPAFGWFCPCRGGVLEEEGAALMEEFFRRRRAGR